MKILVRFILIPSLVLTVFLTPAFAYIDPNAGSIFLQLIIGGVAGVLIFLKVFWKKIVSFFKGGGE